MSSAVGGLSSGAIQFVVKEWIGVADGCLGDFSYRTHEEFYPQFCGIDDIRPNDWPGTTRARFVAILEEQPPHRQRRILEGVLLRCPPDNDGFRTDEKRQRIEKWIHELAQSGVHVGDHERPLPEIAQAALDAIRLDRQSGHPERGVDRAVTALQACLHTLRDEGGWTDRERATLGESFSNLREHHDAFRAKPGEEAFTKLLRRIGNAIDALNDLRNKRSLAHANPTLDSIDARFALDCAEALIQYIWSRASAGEPTPARSGAPSDPQLPPTEG